MAFTRDTAGIQITDMMNDVVEGQRLVADTANRELQYSGAPGNEILYWSLPAQFLGDKVMAYGGSLRFSLRFSSRNGQPVRRDEPLVKISVSTKQSFPFDLDCLIFAKALRSILLEFT